MSIIGLDMWQSTLLIIFILLCINYLSRVLMDKLTERGSTYIDGEGEGEGEGFENMSEKSREDILGPEELYDDFYAKAYNKIFQHDKLVQAEAAIVLQDWEKGMSHADMRILDLCCGVRVVFGRTLCSA